MAWPSGRVMAPPATVPIELMELGWGNNGCGYLPFNEWNRVVEVWVGVSRRATDSYWAAPSKGLFFWPGVTIWYCGPILWSCLVVLSVSN